MAVWIGVESLGLIGSPQVSHSHNDPPPELEATSIRIQPPFAVSLVRRRSKINTLRPTPRL